MATIVRGTTPEIEIVFKETDPHVLAKAVLTLSKGTDDVLSRDLSTATISGKSVSWELTQEETLALNKDDSLSVVCVWVTNEAVRGQSKTAIVYVAETPINEVL